MLKVLWLIHAFISRNRVKLLIGNLLLCMNLCSNLLIMHELSTKDWIPSGPAPVVAQRSMNVWRGGLYLLLLAGKQMQLTLYIPLYSLGIKSSHHSSHRPVIYLRSIYSCYILIYSQRLFTLSIRDM